MYSIAHQQLSICCLKNYLIYTILILSDDQVAEPPGIDPACVDLYIGKVAARDIEQDQSINSWQLTQLQFHLVQVTDGM